MSYFRPKKRSKYGAQRTTHAGMSFASKGEANCYDFLKLLEKAGEISNIRTQVHVYLSASRILYIPDYVFFDHKVGQDVYGDFKGFEDKVWSIKKRLWKSYGPGILRVYKGYGLRITVAEEIVSKRVKEAFVTPESLAEAWERIFGPMGIDEIKDSCFEDLRALLGLSEDTP